MVPTIAMVILMGVAPRFFLYPMEASVTRVIERVTSQEPRRVRFDLTPDTGRLAKQSDQSPSTKR